MGCKGAVDLIEFTSVGVVSELNFIDEPEL